MSQTRARVRSHDPVHVRVRVRSQKKNTCVRVRVRFGHRLGREFKMNSENIFLIELKNYNSPSFWGAISGIRTAKKIEHLILSRLN